MESYIQITKINDFLFCPKSLYFHGMFGGFEKKTYHDTPQIVGQIAHEAIEEGKYSTSKHILQGLEVFSDKYGICGKIDTFDVKSGELVERKYRVKKIYDGFKYQLYAQMFCLQEMGYKVKRIAIYSKADNKKHLLELPTELEIQQFEEVIEKIKHFSIFDAMGFAIPEKCQNCIYRPLCH